MHQVRELVSVAALSCGLIASANAVTTLHTGANNPLSEGFSVFNCCGPAVVSAVSGDQGLDAWQIAASATGSQYGYQSGAFSASDKAAYAAQGLVVSFTARVLQGAAVSVYSAANPVILAGAGIDNGTRRYQVELGLDANGDTVAVLPTSIDNGGAGGRLRAHGGISYTLTGLGNGYHSYSLVLSPNAAAATLFIDGVERLSGYGGYNNIVSDAGLSFAAVSSGVARFAQVQVSAVPEPAMALLLLAGIPMVSVLARFSPARSSRR